MNVILSLVVFAMGVAMFYIPRDKKIAFMLIACVNFALVRLNFLPFAKHPGSFLIVCFILSEWNNYKAIFAKIAKSKYLLLILALLLATFLMAIVFSPHLHSFKEIFKFFQSELLNRYLVLIYAFIAIRRYSSLNLLIRYSFWPLMILTLLGVINLLDHRAFFVTEMMSSWSADDLNVKKELMGDVFAESTRFRVQSMFYNPFDYGYICILLFFLNYYGYLKKIVGKTRFSIVTACSIFGVVFCASRTVFIVFIATYLFFLVLAFELNRSILLVVCSFLIMIGMYLTVPAVAEKVDKVTTVFTDTKGMSGGSSIEMRSVQFATVLSYISDRPLTGRGVNYFKQDMGWAEGNLMDHRLMGVEGVYLVYLLERGFIGYFLYVSIWLCMLFLLLKERHSDRYLASLGIVIFIAYKMFAYMTGELGSPFPTLLLIGSIMGAIYGERVRIRRIRKYEDSFNHS